MDIGVSLSVVVECRLQLLVVLLRGQLELLEFKLEGSQLKDSLGVEGLELVQRDLLMGGQEVGFLQVKVEVIRL